MQKSIGIIIFIVAAIWAFILFRGFVFSVKKSFRPPPASDHQPAAELLKEQRMKNQEAMEQYRRLMEDRKQQLRDMQRR